MILYIGVFMVYSLQIEKGLRFRILFIRILDNLILTRIPKNDYTSPFLNKKVKVNYFCLFLSGGGYGK